MKGERAKCVTDLEEVKAEAEAQKRKKRSRSPKMQKDKGSEWCQQTSRKKTVKPLLQVLSIVKWALNFQWNY